MWRALLRLLSVIFWWGVIIAVVALMGYILWPIAHEKYIQLKLGGWRGETKADMFQDTLEARFGALGDISTQAATDVISDRSGKVSVEYQRGGDGVYRAVNK